LKALVLKEYGKFSVEEVPAPGIGPGEVLVRVEACGICGSDVHGMDGRTGRRIPPIIMGHEAAGTVERVGAGVSEWRPGDRVTFDSTVYCGSCRFCRSGRVNLCENRQVLGVSCREYRRAGAFAEFVAVPRHILYRLPEGVSFEKAALLEPLSVALHAVGRVPVEPGMAALVVGSGVIGLLTVGVLKLRGARPVAAVDLAPARLRAARRMGADHVIEGSSPEIVRKQVFELTGGRGVDVAFEAVGLSETLATALGCVGKGGGVGLIGNVTPETSFPLQDVVTRELSLFGSCASSGEYPEGLDIISKNVLDLDAVISGTAPLEEGALWFDRLYRGDPELIKVILKP